ncbi:hypothetical protein H9P43_008793 [Blastocladiella emersonii ATCC 22665]|nr:hypothetical protein H9P43_008793 [Blastocladiella emersonii ATCC 22665]
MHPFPVFRAPAAAAPAAAPASTVEPLAAPAPAASSAVHPAAAPLWHMYLKHHPIFRGSGNGSSPAGDAAPASVVDPNFSFGLSSGLGGNTSVLSSATRQSFSASASSFNPRASVFGGASKLLPDDLTTDNSAVVDEDEFADAPVRNILAMHGHALAVIVDRELRVVDLRVVKRVADTIPEDAHEMDVATAFERGCPYWRVDLNCGPIDFEVIQLQFNGDGRLLSVLGHRRVFVVHFKNGLGKLSHAPASAHHRGSTSTLFGSRSSRPSISYSHSVTSRAPSSAAGSGSGGGLASHGDTAPPVLHAEGFELGASDFDLGAAPLLQTAWHPASKQHSDLAVLSADGTLRSYDVAQSVEHPFHTDYLLDADQVRAARNPLDPMKQCAQPVAFAFGVASPDPAHVWAPYTVYAAMRDGTVRVVCPVLPATGAVSLLVYKHMVASLANFAVGSHGYVALRRFLGHIDAQIADEFRLLPDADEEVDEVDVHFPIEPTDADIELVFESPVYPSVRALAQPLVLDGDDAPESWAVHHLDVTCTDVCTALTMPAGTDDDATPLPALFLAYNGNPTQKKAGIVDVLALDAALPRWGGLVVESNRAVWVVGPPEAEGEEVEVEGVAAFVLDSIEFPTQAYLRFLPDAIVPAAAAEQVLVAHNEGVHLVRVRPGAAPIVKHVITTVMPATALVAPKNEFGASFARLGGDAAAAPPRAENVVIGFVATADTLLTHSTVVLTRTDAAAAPLVYLCDDDDDAEPDATTGETATAPPGALAETPLSLPLSDLPTAFPVVSIPALHEPALGVSEDQLAYLLAEHDRLARAARALTALKVALDAALARHAAKADAAEHLVRTIAFAPRPLQQAVDAADRAVNDATQRADALLQLFYDATHPDALSRDEREFHRELLRAARAATGLAERKVKLVRFREKLLEDADARAEAAAEARVGEEQEMRIARVLERQLAAIREIEAQVGAVEQVVAGVERMEVRD